MMRGAERRVQQLSMGAKEAGARIIQSSNPKLLSVSSKGGITFSSSGRMYVKAILPTLTYGNVRIRRTDGQFP